jgi:hypothetical protein
MRIVDVREITQPIASPIRNAYIDFSKMTASLVAVVTNVVRDGRRVVGYGFTRTDGTARAASSASASATASWRRLPRAFSTRAAAISIRTGSGPP